MRRHGLKHKYMLVLEQIRLHCIKTRSREVRPTPLGMTIGAIMALHNNGDIEKSYIEKIRSTTGKLISRQVWEFTGDLERPYM